MKKKQINARKIISVIAIPKGKLTGNKKSKYFM